MDIKGGILSNYTKNAVEMISGQILPDLAAIYNNGLISFFMIELIVNDQYCYQIK